jgi:hypothetical protein
VACYVFAHLGATDMRRDPACLCVSRLPSCKNSASQAPVGLVQEDDAPCGMLAQPASARKMMTLKTLTRAAP